MFWEWSEAGLCWYLNRPNHKGDVAKLTVRTTGICVLYIYGEQNRVNETHRFKLPEDGETEACNVASSLYRLYVTALELESQIIAVRPKE